MILVLLALLFCAASVALPLAQLSRVSRALSIDVDTLAPSLKRLPADHRLRELERRAPEGSWERRLAADLLRAPDDAHRVASLNDALRAIEHQLDARSGWPAASLRIALLGGLFLTVLAFLVGRLDLVVPLVGLGALGTLVSAEIGRRSRWIAKRQREAIDALVDAAVGAPRREDPSVRRSRRR